MICDGTVSPLIFLYMEREILLEGKKVQYWSIGRGRIRHPPIPKMVRKRKKKDSKVQQGCPISLHTSSGNSHEIAMSQSLERSQR